MDLGLRGKTAVITGGSKGIGLSVAKTFMSEGVKCVICARNKADLLQSLEVLRPYGDAYGITADVTREADVYALAAYAQEQTGRIDCWVNNVGGSFPKDGELYTEDQIDHITRLCFHSVVYGCQAAFTYMKQQGGAIVNISSLAARCGTVGASTLYGPLKAAVVQLSVMYAGEFAAYGIRVNALLPGFTLTPMVRESIRPEYLEKNVEATLLRKAAEPEEIAKPVVFLSSMAASYITGASLEVAGGRSIVLNPEYSYLQKETREHKEDEE